ncbi:MAG TPA: hypothetical protein VKR32_06900 [Puia sp.]|nr:hypothetical protein [Puia sp.]
MKLEAGIPVKLAKRIDWQLLLFLLVFLQVKLAVKVAAIVVICLLHWNFRFGLRLKHSRLPLFYPLVILISLVGLLFNGGLSPHYGVVFLTAVGGWLMAFLAIHQIRLFVDRNDEEVTRQTMVVYFLINAAVSLGTLVLIMIRTGSLNPYLYQGQHQLFFVSTGDYIKGVPFDTSVTNAILNAFGVIYFLSRKNAGMVLLCMSVVVLTASNLTSLILLAVFACLLVFGSGREQKSLIFICFFMLVVFMAKISPQNDSYAAEILAKITPSKPAETQISGVGPANNRANPVPPLPTHPGNPDTRRLKESELRNFEVPRQSPIFLFIQAGKRPFIPGPNINNAPYQAVNDTTETRKKLLEFIDNHRDHLPLASSASEIAGLPPGKLVGARQTLEYLKTHPQLALFGDGAGKFSSKLALRATGLHTDGGYPASLAYISPEYLINHLDLYLYYFSRQKALHSVINTPDSVYDQLLGEYGLAGLTVLVVCYFGFFIRRIHGMTALALVGLLGGVFFAGYWFEQFSIVPLFELLFFLILKEQRKYNIIHAE